MKCFFISVLVVISIVTPGHMQHLDYYHTPVCGFYQGYYKTFSSIESLMAEIRLTGNYWCLVKMEHCKTIFDNCTDEKMFICAYSKSLDKFRTFTNECQMNREIHNTGIIWIAAYQFACPPIDSKLSTTTEISTEVFEINKTEAETTEEKIFFTEATTQAMISFMDTKTQQDTTIEEEITTNAGNINSIELVTTEEGSTADSGTTSIEIINTKDNSTTSTIIESTVGNKHNAEVESTTIGMTGTYLESITNGVTNGNEEKLTTHSDITGSEIELPTDSSKIIANEGTTTENDVNGAKVEFTTNSGITISESFTDSGTTETEEKSTNDNSTSIIELFTDISAIDTEVISTTVGGITDKEIVLTTSSGTPRPTKESIMDIGETNTEIINTTNNNDITGFVVESTTNSRITGNSIDKGTTTDSDRTVEEVLSTKDSSKSHTELESTTNRGTTDTTIEANTNSGKETAINSGTNNTKVDIGSTDTEVDSSIGSGANVIETDTTMASDIFGTEGEFTKDNGTTTICKNDKICESENRCGKNDSCEEQPTTTEKTSCCEMSLSCEYKICCENCGEYIKSTEYVTTIHQTTIKSPTNTAISTTPNLISRIVNATLSLGNKTVVHVGHNNTYNGPYTERDYYYQPIYNYYNIIPLPISVQNISSNNSSIDYKFLPLPGNSSLIFDLFNDFLAKLSTLSNSRSDMH